MKKFLIKISSIAAILVLGILMVLPAPHAEAASFNKNNIMNDAVFDDYSTMSASQIQSFLNQFSSSCLKNYKAAYPQSYSTYGSKVTAATVIRRASLLWHINPRVILATLEKEEGLVTGGSGCASWRYNSAMGFDCPDSGACPGPGSAGFSRQVTKGSWQLKFNKERAYGHTSWDGDGSVNYIGYMTQGYRARKAGGTVTYYDGHATIDGQNVYMSNGATAALYSYTPHFSGNQHFDTIFTNWFGSPFVLNCVLPQDNSGGVYRLWQPDKHTSFMTSSANEVCVATGNMGYIYDGILFYPSGTGSSSIYRLVRNGHYLFTASTTERDNAETNYGFRLDGVAFTGSTSYDATNSPVPVYRLSDSSGGYFYTVSDAEAQEVESNLGFQMEGVVFYTNNTTGKAFPNDIYRLAHPTAGYLFTASTVERDYAVSKYGYRDEGVGFQTRLGYTTNDLPVYRLASGKGYLYTTSLSERKRAIKLGYRPEGVKFFAYDPSYLGATKRVFRLSHKGGSYLYTISTTERDYAVSKYGYTYEGVVFRVP